jgi:hypothetical protein
LDFLFLRVDFFDESELEPELELELELVSEGSESDGEELESYSMRELTAAVLGIAVNDASEILSFADVSCSVAGSFD